MTQCELTCEQATVRDAADVFARAHLAPVASRMDDEEWWPEHLFQVLGEHGYLGLTAPEELGGSGTDVFTAGLIGQAFARYNPAVGLSWGAHENLCMNNILRTGDASQHKRWLPGAAAPSWVRSGSRSPERGRMRWAACAHGLSEMAMTT